ncbi:MAG: neutral zinc metallopeptidase [Vicinamibacteria bacterium]|nr:neutral zinc metallopeptidase [Vicinamibacteria bacterium]
MRIEGHRRSDNFEDRGAGRGGGRGGLPIQALVSIVRLLGLKGTLIAGAVVGIAFVVMPAGLRQALLGTLTGGGGGASSAPGASVCDASPANGAACDFSRVVLASTEDVWAQKFQAGELPDYGAPRGAYRPPTLVVFANSVTTGGCGSATSDVGPFYCPADQKLYIDPGFYTVMERRLRAPGDFAQAYVIAHEVGHHVQRLIGSSRLKASGESSNEASVRVELQADCLAGVWGHRSRATLQITDEDLREALTAAHAIGDDTLGHSDERKFTHGSSEQRARWFRRGFDGGDARQCDTFAARSSSDL